MAKRIVINPVTRISGFMETDAVIEGKSIEGVLIGIQPYDIDYGMQLSDVLQDKFQNIVDKVKNIIESICFIT